MGQKLIVSKCCAAPLLTKLGLDGTNSYLCAECKKSADQMVYPFTTVRAMEAWLRKRKAFRGMAYTANPTLWSEVHSVWPATIRPFNLISHNKRMCLGSSLGAFLVGCIIGIMIFWALVAR